MGVNKVQYGSQVLLDISDATVTPDTLLAGESAYNAAGEKISGSLDPMLKSEYGGSGPGIVAMADKAQTAQSAAIADKANEANTAQSANTAVNAQSAVSAQTAQNANALGGKSLAQIAPDFAASETLLPWRWLGKAVYRRVYALAKSDFTASTGTYYLANGKNTTAEYTSTTLTKTGLLAGAAQVLPMTQAAWMDGNFRPMPYNRLTAYNFNMGWRLDKSGSSWTFAVETGGNNLSGDGQIALIAYYTK